MRGGRLRSFLLLLFLTSSIAIVYCDSDGFSSMEFSKLKHEKRNFDDPTRDKLAQFSEFHKLLADTNNRSLETKTREILIKKVKLWFKGLPSSLDINAKLAFKGITAISLDSIFFNDKRYENVDASLTVEIIEKGDDYLVCDFEITLEERNTSPSLNFEMMFQDTILSSFGDPTFIASFIRLINISSPAFQYVTDVSLSGWTSEPSSAPTFSPLHFKSEGITIEIYGVNDISQLDKISLQSITENFLLYALKSELDHITLERVLVKYFVTDDVYSNKLQLRLQATVSVAFYGTAIEFDQEALTNILATIFLERQKPYLQLLNKLKNTIYAYRISFLSSTPSLVPSNYPSFSPFSAPTGTPSFTPSTAPSDFPNKNPNNLPSNRPSNDPTKLFSIVPSKIPSLALSIAPENRPSLYPSSISSSSPTGSPTEHPVIFPSSSPSLMPSILFPSSSPSLMPSMLSSKYPSSSPSATPYDNSTPHPSSKPLNMSSAPPTNDPTELPTFNPSKKPSPMPTVTPTSGLITPSRFPTNSSILRIPSPRFSPSYHPLEVRTRNPTAAPTQCLDDATYISPYGFSCEIHSHSACVRMGKLGFKVNEVFELMIRCKKSCKLCEESQDMSKVPSNTPSSSTSYFPLSRPAALIFPPFYMQLQSRASVPINITLSEPPYFKISSKPNNKFATPSLTLYDEQLLVNKSDVPIERLSPYPYHSMLSAEPTKKSPAFSLAVSDEPFQERPEAAVNSSLYRSNFISAETTNKFRVFTSVPSELPSPNPNHIPSNPPTINLIESFFPSTSPSWWSNNPTEVPSEYPTTSPTPCQDDMTYRSRYGFACHVYSFSMCSRMGELGFTMDEVDELVTRCKKSCDTCWLSTNPSNVPSIADTFLPSHNPSEVPNGAPTWTPSVLPSMLPSKGPSNLPSGRPSPLPVLKPTLNPVTKLSLKPSFNPSSKVADGPSFQPSSNPLFEPSSEPKYNVEADLSHTSSTNISPTYMPNPDLSSVPTPDLTHEPTYKIKPQSALPSSISRTKVFAGPTIQLNHASNNTIFNSESFFRSVCFNDPSYSDKYGLTCEFYRHMNCSGAEHIGLSGAEVNELKNSCVDSCNSDCSNEETKSLEMSSDRGETNNEQSSCMDDPEFRNRYGLSCKQHGGISCTKLTEIGFTLEEVQVIKEKCKHSCNQCPGMIIASSEMPTTDQSQSPRLPTEQAEVANVAEVMSYSDLHNNSQGTPGVSKSKLIGILFAASAGVALIVLLTQFKKVQRPQHSDEDSQDIVDDILGLVGSKSSSRNPYYPMEEDLNEEPILEESIEVESMVGESIAEESLDDNYVPNRFKSKQSEDELDDSYENSVILEAHHSNVNTENTLPYTYVPVDLDKNKPKIPKKIIWVNSQDSSLYSNYSVKRNSFDSLKDGSNSSVKEQHTASNQNDQIENIITPDDTDEVSSQFQTHVTEFFGHIPEFVRSFSAVNISSSFLSNRAESNSELMKSAA